MLYVAVFFPRQRFFTFICSSIFPKTTFLYFHYCFGTRSSAKPRLVLATAAIDEGKSFTSRPLRKAYAQFQCTKTTSIDVYSQDSKI